MDAMGKPLTWLKWNPGCDGVDAWAASPTTGAAAWAPVRLVKGSGLQSILYWMIVLDIAHQMVMMKDHESGGGVSWNPNDNM